MQHFPQTRKPRRLMALASAGLLMPLGVAPSLAQGVITPSAAMAPRQEREQLAPALMQAEARQAQATANELAFDESLKRLSQVEASDPAEALTQYKRFFSERALSPALGVQVGLKIARLRLQMGDAVGALQTCEVIGAKYADEPTAALFALEKARVLLGQKQLAQASEEVNEAMPEWVALGPSQYREISDVLLKLVQANLDGGEAEGKERARALCVDLEEVYLRWLKRDTVDHLRERFEVLQTSYQRIGEQEKADELFHKIADALLKMPVDSGNGEAGVMSLQMAQWLFEKQNSRSTNGIQAEQNAIFQLYAKAAVSSDDFHSVWSIVEGYGRQIESNPQQAELRLLQLQKEIKTPSARLASQFMLAWARYKAGDWKAFLAQSKEVLANYERVEEKSRRQSLARIALRTEEAQKWAKLWQENAIVAENPDLDLRFDGPFQQPVERRIFVDTPVPTQLQVTVEGDVNRVSARIEASPWASELSDARHQQIVVLTVAPGEPKASAVLRITSAANRSEPLRLLVKVSISQTEAIKP